MNGKMLSYGIVALVLAAFAGFAFGRWASPDKVVTQEKTVYVDKVVATVDTQRVLDALKTIQQQTSKQADVKVVRVTVKDPNGTTTTTETREDKSKTEAKTDTKVATEDKANTHTVTERIVYQDREVTKTVERARPAWGFTLSPGYDVAGALGSGSSYSLIPSGMGIPHLVVGAGLDRRLLGPLSVGVAVNTQGVASAAFRLEF